MSVEWMYGHEEKVRKTYCSPHDLVAHDIVARRTYRDFLESYVGDQKNINRLRDGLPPLERTRRDGQRQVFTQEMFTGYGGLGELVHIRVEPKLTDEADGYFIALANLQGGEIGEPVIRRVDRFRDFRGGPQTILYLDDDRCDEWPSDYQPMIHLDQTSLRFTYRPGFGQGESLLRPIDGLILPPDDTETDVPVPRPSSEPMGQRALALVRLT